MNRPSPVTSRRIVIAGTGSGAGKTTVTLAIMAALKERGYVVQGFKCGPDYIDPTYHTAVTGRPSRNLDGWMLGPEAVKEIFAKGSDGADISIIEGAMGLYDGKSPLSDEGSAAQISQIVDAEVLLVVNVQSMARSAAAVVKGFQTLSPGVRIAGVIANKAGSEGHYRIVKEAIEHECGIPVVGYLLREEAIDIPERHLGLVPSIERGELNGFFAELGRLAAAYFDLEQLLHIAERPVIACEPKLFAHRSQPRGIRIAVAKDAAFHFYYPENLELLEAFGAELVYFSPLAGEEVPEEADGLYIGGGFPEEFAERLAVLEQVKASIRRSVKAGMPTLAECGGFMYLTEAITDTQGRSYPMVGLLPGAVKMQRKLAALGYREVSGTEGNFLLGDGQMARGHEFHYSAYERPAAEDDMPQLSHAYTTKGRQGTKREGFATRSLVAGYTHVHFASNPDMAARWVQACESYREEKRAANR
ncbi:cobyrinate a,c-diamide synthase [Paenibacillus ginsengarvi]|uniref:Cobyrinate a,c-diamide synthase n=1 Tax=Paenibacillus ginsengarvi TaxID=400777 RepID=A0A3B0BP30_9BACL|nr:cobyrinate a,c-diamide synthase [Paenibacillus ginsengarvi]RKN74148.1 cobyrinate a,c-diamide synthase [Paenibacillus ginsengarvi]